MTSILRLKITQYVLLALSMIIPFVLWLATPMAVPRFDSISAALASLGELAGIFGIVLFSLTIILSMRPRFLESMLGGLNNLYIKHSHLGQIAFMLILLHPLLLLTRYADNIGSAADFFKIGNSLQQDLGIIALLSMVALIVLTLYFRPKYHIWKSLHKLFGGALFLGALHVYLSPSYVLNNNIWLFVYILGLVGVAVLLWIYKSVFGMILTRRYKYTVIHIDKLLDKILEIEMQPNKGSRRILHEPGQFVFIKFLQEGISAEVHPFSIVSAPTEQNLKVSVKVLGDYTSVLFERLGQWAQAQIEGPFGTFSYKKIENKKQVWIAGGVGITPFVSMAKDLINTTESYDIVLYYAVRNKSEAVYLNLLQDISNKVPGFKVYPHYSDDGGFIIAEQIAADISDINKRDIMLCAPPAMIHSLKIQFKDLGLNTSQLHSEEFNL